jgi:hypothetical protein
VGSVVRVIVGIVLIILKMGKVNNMNLRSSFFVAGVSFGILFFVGACKPSGPAKCRAGLPVAIFSDSIKGVKKHTFKQEGQTGIEVIMLNDNSIIEIFQTGCNEIKQQYTHTRKVNLMAAPDSFFVNAAIKEFSGYAKLDPQLATFGEFANAIQNIKTTIKIAEPANLGEGFYVTVDRILSPEKTSLILTLSKTLASDGKGSKEVKW